MDVTFYTPDNRILTIGFRVIIIEFKSKVMRT